MIWKVLYDYREDGHVKEKAVYIEADDFDETIEKARELDVRYCCAQVVDDNV